MSKFLKTIVLDTTFDGDGVQIQLNRLRRSDLLRWLPELRKMREADSNEDKAAAINNFVDAHSAELADYVVGIYGLKDAQGSDVSARDIFEYSYFLPLSTEIFGALFQGSFVGEVGGGLSGK